MTVEGWLAGWGEYKALAIVFPWAVTLCVLGTFLSMLFCKTLDLLMRLNDTARIGAKRLWDGVKAVAVRVQDARTKLKPRAKQKKPRKKKSRNTSGPSLVRSGKTKGVSSVAKSSTQRLKVVL